MSRSLKKGPYVDAKLLQKIEELNSANKRQVIRTWSRARAVARVSSIHTWFDRSWRRFSPTTSSTR